MENDEYTMPVCELWGVFGSSFLVYAYQISRIHLFSKCTWAFVCKTLCWIQSSCPVLSVVRVCVHIQVSEGGPSHYVLAPAELGPGEDAWSSRRALHGSV